MLRGRRRPDPVAGDLLHGEVPRAGPDLLSALELAGRGVRHHGIQLDLLLRDEALLIIPEELRGDADVLAKDELLRAKAAPVKEAILGHADAGHQVNQVAAVGHDGAA